MTPHVSSAQPDALFRYSSIAASMDSALFQEAGPLASALGHFEATCAEYRVPVSHLPEGLRGHARQASQVDAWVHDVGAAFQTADQIALVAGMIRWGGGRALDSWTLIREYAGRLDSILGYAKPLAGAALLLPSMLTKGVTTIRAPGWMRDLPSWIKKTGFGPRGIREWAGASDRLNWIRGANVNLHFLKQGLKITKADLAITAIANFASYGLTSTTLSATLVDVGILVGTIAAGAVIGGLIAGFGAPAGVVLGAVVLTRLAATWVLGNYRDGAIGAVDGAIRGGAQKIAEITRPTVEAIVRGASKGVGTVRGVTSDVVQSISGRVESRVSEEARMVRGVTRSTVEAISRAAALLTPVAGQVQAVTRSTVGAIVRSPIVISY
jgi:hypothetical protein